MTLKQRVELFEKVQIEQSLKLHGGKLAAVRKELHLSAQGLTNKLLRYQIPIIHTQKRCEKCGHIRHRFKLKPSKEGTHEPADTF